MSRRLMFGSAAATAPVNPTDPGGGDPDPGGDGWPTTTDTTLLSLRPTGVEPLATMTATPGDNVGDLVAALSTEIGNLVPTPYGGEGPDHGGILFLPPGTYIGGFGTGRWLSIVGTTGNPEDVIIFSDTEDADGVIHPYGPIHVEGVTLKAGFSETLQKSPKYCAHIAGSQRATFANVIFDAYDARPGGFGNAGTVGCDGNVGAVVTFYKCEFIRQAEVTDGNSMNMHGGPEGLLPMSVAFIDCTMPDGAGFGGGGTADGGHDELYVIGGTLGGPITTSETTDTWTDHPNAVENPAGGASTVGAVTRNWTDWPTPDPDSGAGLTPGWHDFFYPHRLFDTGTIVEKASVTDAAPMTPVAGRTYYCPVPVTDGLWFNRSGLQVHTGTGKAIQYRPQPDAGTYYGSIEPGNMPVPENLENATLGSGQWLTSYYYSWMMYPSTNVGGTRLWFHFKMADTTGVSIDGSASLPGLHDCYYSDNNGTTLIKATAGTPFPLAHAAQVQ